MLSWKPIKNVENKEGETKARAKIALLQKLAVIFYPILFISLFLTNKFPGGKTIFSALLGLLTISIFYIWLKYRKYYISLMEKTKSVNHLYYEDYSWKDSLVMLSLLIAGCVSILILLFKFFPK